MLDFLNRTLKYKIKHINYFLVHQIRYNVNLNKDMENIINQDNLNQKKVDNIKLITKIEAILYLKGRPLSIKKLSEITNTDLHLVERALEELKIKYSDPKSALELNENKSSISLELKQNLNEFVEDLLPAELKTAVLRTLAVIAIKKKILQSDLILLRGSSAYEHIKELIDKKFIQRRRRT